MSIDVTETMIKMLGRTCFVKCKASDVPMLHQAAKQLEARLRALKESNQAIHFEQVILVTALNLTQELLSSERQKNQFSQNVNQKLIQLNNRIDDLLADYSQLECFSEET